MGATNIGSQGAGEENTPVRGSKPVSAESVFIADGAVVAGATCASQQGPEWVSEPTNYDAILLAGFGGPEGQDDVIPFLRNVTRGRGIPDERLEEVAHHYRHFGGVSPINNQNRELKAALEARLAERGIDLPVLWGNRNWDPYLNDALTEAKERGFTKLIAIATSAYSSYSSCRQYREDFADALFDTGLGGEIQIDKVRSFYNHPGFVQPFLDGVRAAVAESQEAGFAPEEVELLFATHSIPTDDAVRSGNRETDFGPHGAYEKQHLEVSELVANEAAPGYPWKLVYQSRSGPPTQPWLEPDINDVIEDIGETRKAIIVVPIGFVSDHMEVMWDLDEEAKESAEEQNLWFRRVATPGSDPAYVEGLIDLVLERVNGTPVEQRPALTKLGVDYDVCRPGCCENPRLGFRPALAGIAP
ncbi:ferrochelatase [Humidisolicoccus flavus]|uniref:ferrochelatase n=1 Tax=Humidisolicoccus flavus TaxID=3111414 RepID=UPI00324DB689